MRTQQGFVFFELLLSAAIALLIAVWAGQAMFNRINDAGAQQSARWMLMIRNGMHAYLDDHGDLLRHAVLPTDLQAQGYQDWAEPRISELKADGLLAAGFPESMRVVDGARIHVLREGECPGDACRIGAVIHSKRAFRKTAGIVDEQMLAQWLLVTQGLGGIIHPSQPDVIRGHTFQMSNPLYGGTVLPAGTVAMAISDDQLHESAYLRVRDKRDPQFQSDVTVQGDITAGGVVSAGEYLQLESAARALSDCDSEGAVTRDQSHGLLVCASGTWQTVSPPSGGFSLNSDYGCFTADGVSSANPVTGDCSCPRGHLIVPISEGVGIHLNRGITRGFLCVR